MLFLTARNIMDYVKLIVLGFIAVLAAMASSWGHDLAYQVHAFLIMVIVLAFRPQGLLGERR